MIIYKKFFFIKDQSEGEKDFIMGNSFFLKIFLAKKKYHKNSKGRS